MATIKRTDIYEGGDPFKDIKESIDLLSKKEAELIDLNKQLQKTYVDLGKTATGAEAKELIANTEKLKTATENLDKTQKVKKKTVEMVTKAELLLRQEQSERLKTLKDEIQAEKTAADSLNGMALRMKKLKQEYRDMSKEQRESTKAGRDMARQIKKLSDELEKQEKAIGQAGRGVGKYADAIQNVGLKLIGIYKAIEGAVMSVRWFNDEIKKTSEAQLRLQNAFQSTGTELKGQIAQVRTLASVYKVDYENIVKSANAVSKEFGITGTEALNLISDALKRGANNTGELFDILREYPAQMAQIGMSADEAFGMITQQVNSGVYSDKGIDALKEAGIALREMTPMAEKALKMIGLSGTEIQKQLSTGSKTTFQVVKEISDILGKLPQNSQAYGTVLADIFKSAGEDAGVKFVESLGKINQNFRDMPVFMDDTTAANLRLSTAWNTFITDITLSDSALTKARNFVVEMAAAAFELFIYENKLEKSYAEQLAERDKQRAKQEEERKANLEKSRIAYAEYLKGLADADALAAENKKKADEKAKEDEKKRLEEKKKAAEKRAEIDENYGELYKDTAYKLLKLDGDLSDANAAALETLKKINSEKLKSSQALLAGQQLVTDAQIKDLNKWLAAYNSVATQSKGLGDQIREQNEELGEIMLDSMADILTEIVTMQEGAMKSFLQITANGIADALEILLAGLIKDLAARAIANISSQQYGKAAANVAGIVALKAAPDIVSKGTARLIQWYENRQEKRQNFATGGEIHGPGTATSDSVPINASKGEFMLTAEKYSKAKGLVQAIHTGKITDANAKEKIQSFNDSRLVGILEQQNALLSNLGYTYQKNGQTIIISATGGKTIIN